MFIEFKIPIPIDVTNNIQAYDLDFHAKRTLMTYIIGHADLDITQEQIDNYKVEYTTAYSLFELAKKQLEKDYIQPVFTSSVDYSWVLDYDTSIIIITIKDATS